MLGEHLAGGARALPNEFYRVRPQVLRTVLVTLGQAVAETVAILGDVKIHEPRFTRQLFVAFQAARDAMPSSPRYDITHQPEQPIADETGVVLRHRRLDLRLVFARQLGRTGDYVCIECKYLDTGDRSTDRDYVDDGVERIVCGDYAAGHPWAVMVGLERIGPLHVSATNVNQRLHARYGPDGGFKSASSIHLADVHESEHRQGTGSHQITIVHGFFLIARPRERQHDDPERCPRARAARRETVGNPPIV